MDPLGITLFLTQFAQALGGWIGQTATAVNYLLGVARQPPPPAPPVLARPVTAINNTSPIASTTSTVFVYSGVSVALTPTKTGTVFVTGAATVSVPSGTAAEFDMSYVAGAAPAVGAAATGTVFSPSSINVADGVAQNSVFPFQGLVTGLTLNTPYSLMLNWKISGTAASTSLFFSTITAWEL